MVKKINHEPHGQKNEIPGFQGVYTMKKIAVVMMMTLVAGLCFAQQARVAVAPFTATSGNAASDAETIAEIFGLELQAKNVVRVFTRGNILSVMNENYFQMSDLSSDEKTASIGKAANADWVVRGEVRNLGARIVVTATLLDVNTLEIMGGAPMYMNTIEEAANKMEGFITTITQRITGGGSGQAAQGGQRPGGGAPDSGIGIEVNTRVGGTLYFQNKELTVLWDNDTYTIPIERPGTYTVRMVFGNGDNEIQTATISTRGITKINFSEYVIGDIGPGGGMVFFAQGGKYMEVSGILGEHNWSAALTVARNHKGGGFSDWRLPTKDELNLVYQNLRAKNIGNLGDRWHWSSSEYDDDYAWIQRFSDGHQIYLYKANTDSVRAVRAF
jgi:TolB-like protein